MSRKEQIAEARRSGLSYRKIGKELGISGTRVWQIANKTKSKKRRELTEKDCSFPNIRRWANENGVRIGDIAIILYGRREGVYTMQARKVLTGGGYLYKDKIDIPLRATGMSYEEAFADG